jgi:hypothetical protein
MKTSWLNSFAMITSIEVLDTRFPLYIERQLMGFLLYSAYTRRRHKDNFYFQSVMIRKFKQWWSSIPAISTTRTITSHWKSRWSWLGTGTIHVTGLSMVRKSPNCDYLFSMGYIYFSWWQIRYIVTGLSPYEFCQHMFANELLHIKELRTKIKSPIPNIYA